MAFESGEQRVTPPDEDAGVPPRTGWIGKQPASSIAVRLLDEACDATDAVSRRLAADDVAVAGRRPTRLYAEYDERAVVRGRRGLDQRPP